MPALKRTTPTKTPKKRPKHAGRSRMWLSPTGRRKLVWGLFLMVFAVLGLGGGWFFALADGANVISASLEKSRRASLDFSARMGLRVTHVLVIGRNRVSRAKITRVLGAKQGSAILAFDPHGAKLRLEKLSWIRAATVERRLPDTLYVRLAERVPLALWQRGGRLALIDREGVVIDRNRLGTWRHLPMAVGKDAPKHAEAMIEIMRAHPKLMDQTHAMIRVSKRRWDLKFNNGVIARLPEKDAARAVLRLARLVTAERILDRDIVMIDLRLADRLVVRTSPKAKPLKKKRHAQRGPSKDT
ncbi:MAG: cell division protein FtsQ/DivIB [Alphaproteobacteria bacterium]|jgi:cell division protein FtsQ